VRRPSTPARALQWARRVTCPVHWSERIKSDLIGRISTEQNVASCQLEQWPTASKSEFGARTEDYTSRGTRSLGSDSSSTHTVHHSSILPHRSHQTRKLKVHNHQDLPGIHLRHK
jgi:hypothetical protein